MSGFEEESTRSNFQAKSHSQPTMMKREIKDKSPLRSESEYFDLPKGLLDQHDTIHLARIPRKSQVQQMIDKDDESAMTLKQELKRMNE